MAAARIAGYREDGSRLAVEHDAGKVIVTMWDAHTGAHVYTIIPEATAVEFFAAAADKIKDIMEGRNE